MKAIIKLIKEYFRNEVGKEPRDIVFRKPESGLHIRADLSYSFGCCFSDDSKITGNVLIDFEKMTVAISCVCLCKPEDKGAVSDYLPEEEYPLQIERMADERIREYAKDQLDKELGLVTLKTANSSLRAHSTIAYEFEGFFPDGSRITGAVRVFKTGELHIDYVLLYDSERDKHASKSLLERQYPLIDYKD